MIDPAVQHHLVDAIAAVREPRPAGPFPDGLTAREAEVLSLATAL